MAKVSMHITVETEYRGDCWTCYVPEFGFTVYGESPEAARLEVDNALAALVGSFFQDLEAIERFLEGRNVKYSIQTDSETDRRNPTTEMSHADVLIA